VSQGGKGVALIRARLKPVGGEAGEPGKFLPAGDLLRAVRAVEVLERIGTAEARKALARYAGGPPGRLAREARATLARLDRLAAAAKRALQPLPPPPDPVEGLWKDLGEADAVAGHRAVWALVENPEVALTLIGKRLRPPAGKLPEGDGLQVPAGDLLRGVRAIQVLERIGTPPAGKLLETLSASGPARWARDARAALKRLNQRTGKQP
jgi:hypothetical protein